MKYSVIIPVYNAEATLGRCLNSLAPQLSDDSELLLINDGSSDGTKEICRAYAERYPRIRLFSKTNGGVSSARNMGLDHAAGDYVLFVDADDAVRPDYFERLDEALQDSPDLLLFRRQLMGRPARRMVHQDHAVFCQNREQSCRVLSRCLRKQELNLITTKAFRREIIEKHALRFDERLHIGEDKVFSFAFSLLAETIKSITTPLYYLSMDDPNSLSRKKRDHLCQSVLLEHRLMSDLLRQTDLPVDCKKRYRDALSYSFYRSAYTVARELRKYDLLPGERRIKVREILDAYAREPMDPPAELFCKCVALPIRRKQAHLVDGIMGCVRK